MNNLLKDAPQDALHSALRKFFEAHPNGSFTIWFTTEGFGILAKPVVFEGLCGHVAGKYGEDDVYAAIEKFCPSQEDSCL